MEFSATKRTWIAFYLILEWDNYFFDYINIGRFY